jgi:hypothetical protein
MKTIGSPVATIFLAVMIFLSPLLLPRSSPVTRQAFDRIEAGMSRQEDEAILGGPPGDYQSMPRQPTFENPDNRPAMMKLGTSAEWWGDEGMAWVAFDWKGLVIMTDFSRMVDDTSGPLDIFRWRLGCLKERMREILRK